MINAAVAAEPVERPRRRAWARFVRHRGALASLVLLALIVLAALAAPLVEWWLGHGPEGEGLLDRFRPPSWEYPLGTDDAGRDVLLRLMYGGRISLMVGLAAALASAVVGTAVGILAGYYGGRLDAFLMRVTDFVIALPTLALLIVLAAIDLKKLGLPDSFVQSEAVSLYRIIAIISLVGWTMVARLVRGATLSVRTRDYVRAAVALGAPARRVILVHILPNVIGPVIVATTLSVGGIILTESVLSFLGLGIQPPAVSWGSMLTDAQTLMREAPQLAIYPGIAIMLTVIAFNFLGDGLQDALDPRAGE
jgi:peptide/nickel transport system permease protein